MSKERIDKYLVTIGLAQTRSQAQQLLEREMVIVNGKVQKKPSLKVGESDEIKLTEQDIYVGRGALKIEKAMESFNIDFSGAVFADIGASTGGFTDYLLRNGAQSAYCIDVGHDQLAKSLLEDERVHNFEGVNVKHPFELPSLVDFCVVDLSFISLKLIINNLVPHLKEGGAIYTLFKPQFEAGKERVGKQGIVRDAKVHQELLIEFKEWLGEQGLIIKGLTDSPIKGKDGNREFLLHIEQGHESLNFDIESALQEIF